MSERKRKIQIPLRLSEEESRLLLEKSQELGMNQSEYIRMMIKGRPIDYPEISAELKQLRNEISRVGNNINQIAHSNNAGFYRRDDMALLTAYLVKVKVLFEELQKKLGD